MRSRTFCLFQSVIRIVVEDEDHHGEARNRYGPAGGISWGMPFITFSRGMVTCCSTSSAARARPLGDDPGIIVGHVGIGLDREVLEGEEPGNEEEEREGHHKEPFVEGEIDDGAYHGLSPLLLGRGLKGERVHDHFLARRNPRHLLHVAGKRLSAFHFGAAELAGLRGR